MASEPSGPSSVQAPATHQPPAELLARIQGLELRARTAVEGLPGGSHRSHFRGSSSTFAEHRAYTPGDDIRHLDWKVAARSDRLMVRQFEAETDLATTLLIDSSASMSYSSGGPSKWQYATWAAAAMGLLLANQGDRFALAASHEQALLPEHKGGMSHWRDTLHQIARQVPQGQGDAVELIEQAIPQLNGRGLVVWISDCLAEPASILRAAAQLRHAGHDLIVFRTLDPAEVDFNFESNTRFDDLESDLQLRIQPQAVRQAYRAAFDEHADALRVGLLQQGASFSRVRTDEPLDAILATFLARRQARLRKEGL
ncbi:MAG: DUF58 domain-containing protein [Planctomycetes bacterium]|nr:DUF58 domain-containing protein [Planctomycetota bacterium]MBT4182435.1 DUF58 domain-containing protein [Candidatus Thioglobus sp.]MBT4027818.1 DUF58 domain-containing protein [Planctomycetota bacterium]MBT4560419.1 DUF58 domain-containing protein [Planctomycetota bacterium]MBT5101130.1 DUF58 domain-containing protein [Planctomycetota bacterium]